MPVGDQKGEKARVNLEYKSKIEGGRNKTLPYRMMVLGDYSPQSAEKNKPIADRRAWQIDKSTFNQTLAEMAPSLELVVDNKLEETPEGEEQKKLSVKLQFKHRDDFSPDKLVNMIPELGELLKMRDAIKDLRSRMVKSDELTKVLTKVLSDPEARAKLQAELTDRRASEEPKS